MTREAIDDLPFDQQLAILREVDRRRRREYAHLLTPPPLAPGERMTARHPLVALGAASREPLRPPERAGGWTCNACGAPNPTPGVCPRCWASQEARERDVTIRRAIAREIPAEYIWAHWGAPELAERVAGGADTIRRARAAFALFPHKFPVVALVGDGGHGKTILVAAWAREQLKLERPVRWVHARDLERTEGPDGETLPRERAMTAPILVLDNVGPELDGAPVGQGIIAQRRKAVCDVVEHRRDKGLPMVITTPIGAKPRPPKGDTKAFRDAMAVLYGDNIGRRVHERAVVVRVEEQMKGRS